MDFFEQQKVSHELLTHFCNNTIASENKLSEHITNLVARQLAVSYTRLDEDIHDAIGDNWMIEIKPFRRGEYATSADGQYFEPLLKIHDIVQSALEPYIDGFYLHGSLATMDYVKGWSDVDTFMILSHKTVTDAGQLVFMRPIIREINEVMKGIDTLQHHGVILATAVDMKLYPEQFLPRVVFRNMRCMAGLKNIQCYVRPLPAGFDCTKGVLQLIIDAYEKGVFEHHAYGDEYLLAEYQNAHNAMYQFKYYLGQFLLLPSLYATAIGQPCYKRESFDRVRGVFPGEIMDWIDLISQLRAQWGAREGMEYVPNAIPEWVRTMIPREYFQIGATAARLLLDHITKEYV